MGKTQFCRICRTEKNLKYTSKELRQLNKKQLLLAHTTQQGQGVNDRASKKLLLTTPTLGNICQLCDERIQIYHRLDDAGHESCSDVEIEVVENTNNSHTLQHVENLAKTDFAQRSQRPETPVIVDDDDMLFNMFMQKLDQKTQLQRHQMESSLPQSQRHPIDGHFVHQFHAPYTPPQSSAGGSEGDETKVIEVLTSRESTPTPKITPQTLATPSSHVISNSNLIDSQGHRIVAIIELDDNDENEPKNHQSEENHSGLLTPATSSSNELSFTESIHHRSGLVSPIKNGFIQSPGKQGIDQPSATCAYDDDEEIVFRKVDGATEKSTPMKKRKRKSYDEKELRLVASLSLVSSDSETEDGRSLKASKYTQKSQNTASTSENVPTLIVNKTAVTCKVCKMKLPDSESLSVHELIHDGVKCILCQVGFQQVKRLIYHMRRKHREYNGDALFEKPRSGQDSCMTIRLRYMQRTTFYECQLCGRIDEVFREHKEHIIEKHASESKTLKDPIMKQLKCPVCKAKCGAQYLSLCRHLITTHDYQLYKSHLRELVHVSAFGWNEARQQEVSKTAKIFQFIKRKTLFFECRICRKVVAGYLHHLRHINKHKNAGNEKTNIKSITSTSNTKEIPPAKSCPNEIVVENMEGIGISKKIQKLDNKSKKILKKSKLNNKSMQIDKVKAKEKAKKILKPKTDEQELQPNLKNKQAKIEKSKRTPKISETVAEISDNKKKIQIKLNLKPKEKIMKKLPNVEKSTKGKTKKDTSSKNGKNSEKQKGKNKQKHKSELKPQLKKVKVKPPIRQVDLPKFKCRYCLKKIKGFRLYNLHLLQQHKENEYTKCNICNKTFLNSPTNKLQIHIKQCKQLLPASCKLKRKNSEKSTNSENLSETCAKKVPEHEDFINITKDDNNRWLKELLQLRKELKLETSSISKSTNTALCVPNQQQTNLQCCYCLHLFVNEQDLKEHTKLQHSQHKQVPQILIRYKPFKNYN